MALASPPFASPAFAAPPLAESLHGEAKDAYSAAKLLFLNHDYSGALTQFGRAYELAQDPRLLFDMAVCEKNLRHYVRMHALLERYVADPSPLISPESRATAREALAAIQGFVGSLRVAASEGGASVSLDGEPVGVTPLAKPVSVDLGKHVVGVRKAGFAPTETTVEVPGGVEVPVEVHLTPEVHAARLVVSADAAAAIAVDGALAATGRFDRAVAPGAHELSVTEPGRRAYPAQVDLHAGETRTLEVSLEREAGAPVWPWIVGATVVAAGAAVGGYFLFKPKDQAADVPEGNVPGARFLSVTVR
jgi:hypothetical protein